MASSLKFSSVFFTTAENQEMFIGHRRIAVYNTFSTLVFSWICVSAYQGIN